MLRLLLKKKRQKPKSKNGKYESQNLDGKKAAYFAYSFLFLL